MLARRLLPCLIAILVFASADKPAQAQDPFSEFFGGLFGGGHRQAPAQPPKQMREPRVRRIIPNRENRAPTYWHAPSEKPRRPARKPEDMATPAAPATPTAPVVATPTIPPSFFIATLGDTLGILLANGLQENFADRPEVAVLRKAKDSSGLVRDDYFDWVKAAREIAGGPEKINVAVIMIGSNDRQPIQRGGESLEPLSPKWREVYAQRVDAVIAAFKEKNIPIVWVGLPLMKNERFSGDMEQLNEIYRERVVHAGQKFVDVWEVLADENGEFSAFGPDINGQIVKLRTTDGVHFTDAGARNIAHFVEGEAKVLFETQKPASPKPAAPPAPTASAPASAPTVAVAPPAQPLVFRSPVSGPAAAPTLPERPDIGAAQPLDAPAAAESELARRAAAPVANSQALVKHVIIDGGDQPARPNRADDSRWRGP